MSAPVADNLPIVRDQRDPFAVMDSWDDEALLAEMQGAIAKSLVYEFKQGGQTIVGLSKVGVDECCLVLSEQGQVIREDDLSYSIVGEGQEREAHFKAKASRYAVSPTGEVLLDVVIGVKRQPLYELRKGGAMSFNPFWYEAGAMKAVRNARFRLIPSKVREGVIAEAKRKGKVRSNQATPQTGPMPERSTSPDPGDAAERDPESQALDEIEAILPELAENQQEWVREKLSDGADPIALLETLQHKIKRANANA